jgi:hypothetical protein
MLKKAKKTTPKQRKFSSLKTQVSDIDKDITAKRPIAVRNITDGQRLLRRLFLLRQKGEIDSEYVTDMCKLLDRLILLGKELDFEQKLTELDNLLKEKNNADGSTDSMAKPLESEVCSGSNSDTSLLD